MLRQPNNSFSQGPILHKVTGSHFQTPGILQSTRGLNSDTKVSKTMINLNYV